MRSGVEFVHNRCLYLRHSIRSDQESPPVLDFGVCAYAILPGLPDICEIAVTRMDTHSTAPRHLYTRSGSLRTEEIWYVIRAQG
jgi:hypothetical protein